MSNETYNEWRKELHEAQTAIDELEENYWETMEKDSHKLTHPEAHQTTQEYYEKRAKLVEKLETLLANTPPM